MFIPINYFCFVNKKENIFNAAFSLFVTEGEQATSMKRIAEKANCGIGTMYNYFESKEVLIYELFKKLKSELFTYILKDFDDTMSIKLKFDHVWTKVINYGLEHPEKYRYMVIYSTNCKIPDSIKEESNNMNSLLHSIYDEGIKSGLIKNKNITAMLFFNNGAISNSVIHNDTLNRSQIRDIVNMAWDAIKT